MVRKITKCNFNWLKLIGCLWCESRSNFDNWVSNKRIENYLLVKMAPTAENYPANADIARSNVIVFDVTKDELYRVSTDIPRYVWPFHLQSIWQIFDWKYAILVALPVPTLSPTTIGPVFCQFVKCKINLISSFISHIWRETGHTTEWIWQRALKSYPILHYTH